MERMVSRVSHGLIVAGGALITLKSSVVIQ